MSSFYVGLAGLNKGSLPSGLVRGWNVLDEAGWKGSAIGFSVRG